MAAALSATTFMGASLSVAAPAARQARAVFAVQAGPGPAGTKVITKKGKAAPAKKAGLGTFSLKKAAPAKKAAPKKSGTFSLKKAAPAKKAAPKKSGTFSLKKAAPAKKAAPKKSGTFSLKKAAPAKKAAPKKPVAKKAVAGVAANPLDMFAADSFKSGAKKGSKAAGAQLYVGYKGSNETGSAPVNARTGKAGKVYKLGPKNVDEYSPIYVPETRSSTGDTYQAGAAGLAVWAAGLAGLLATSGFLIYSTSAL